MRGRLVSAVAEAPLQKAAGDDLVYSAERVGKLIAKSEKAIQAAFLDAVRRIRTAENLNEIARLLEAGRAEEALKFAEGAARRVASAVNLTYIAAGQDTAEFLSNGGLGFVIDFDVTNHRAVRHMQMNRLRLVSQLADDAAAATREALIDGTRRGINPIDMAREFRDSIGLTEKQVRSVNNYRKLLEKGTTEALTRKLRDRRFDSTVRRAARTGKPLTKAQIDAMVTRYGERYVKYRSEVIARTESLSEVHAGNEEGFQQAYDEGQLSPEQVEKEWHISPDSLVRDPAHTMMRGQKQPEGSPFISGAGNRLMHPGDRSAPASETVQCRCAMSRRIVRLALAA